MKKETTKEPIQCGNCRFAINPRGKDVAVVTCSKTGDGRVAEAKRICANYKKKDPWK